MGSDVLVHLMVLMAHSPRCSPHATAHRPVSCTHHPRLFSSSFGGKPCRSSSLHASRCLNKPKSAPIWSPPLFQYPLFSYHTIMMAFSLLLVLIERGKFGRRVAALSKPSSLAVSSAWDILPRLSNVDGDPRLQKKWHFSES